MTGVRADSVTLDVALRWNGTEVRCRAGETVAVALLCAGRLDVRRSPRTGSLRVTQQPHQRYENRSYPRRFRGMPDNDSVSRHDGGEIPRGVVGDRFELVELPQTPGVFDGRWSISRHGDEARCGTAGCGRRENGHTGACDAASTQGATSLTARPSHHRRSPDCARECATAPLRLDSCAPRPTPSCCHAFIMTAGPESRHFDRVPSVSACSAPTSNLNNDHTDTPTTTLIDGLFYLSLSPRPGYATRAARSPKAYHGAADGVGWGELGPDLVEWPVPRCDQAHDTDGFVHHDSRGVQPLLEAEGVIRHIADADRSPRSGQAPAWKLRAGSPTRPERRCARTPGVGSLPRRAWRGRSRRRRSN